jgi:hypothetical protein
LDKLMDSVEARIAAIESFLEGKRVKSDRVEICIKGVVLGFPAALEAFTPHFPFGLNYAVETKVVEDPSQEELDTLKITLRPRIARGLLAQFFRLLFFEPKGQSVEEARIDSRFVCSYNNGEEAKRFARYPGVAETLVALHRTSEFTDLSIKGDAGLYLAHPVAFDKVDVDQCREIFRLMGVLGQVIFDAFS